MIIILRQIQMAWSHDYHKNVFIILCLCVSQLRFRKVYRVANYRVEACQGRYPSSQSNETVFAKQSGTNYKYSKVAP